MAEEQASSAQGLQRLKAKLWDEVQHVRQLTHAVEGKVRGRKVVLLPRCNAGPRRQKQYYRLADTVADAVADAAHGVRLPHTAA